MKQLDLPLPVGHGGRRKNAGRPKLPPGERRVVHRTRPTLNSRHPIHVTLKLAPGLPSLRRRHMFRMLRLAVRKANQRGFAVAHFAILSNHLHLILETQTPSVAKLFQGLAISFAKRLNASLGREGRVFLDRYHLHILRTPAEVRRALSYVLTNEAHHRAGAAKVIHIDRFSSAFGYRDLRALVGPKVKLEYESGTQEIIFEWLEEFVRAPRTWLLKEGWKRAQA